MGFMKKMKEENKFDRIVYCDKCGSDNAEFLKLIGFGEKMGTVYHYKRLCKECGRKYHVKRNKYVFEKVKDTDWLKSKSYKNRELLLNK